MKIYAIYAEMDDEPRFYVEAKDIDDLIKILIERERKGEPYTMFPGWNPVAITKKKMYQKLKRFHEDDIELVDADKRESFTLFARMQLDDRAIIEKLKKYKLYQQKYSVNITDKDIEKIERDHALYQKQLSKIIQQVVDFADHVYGQLIHLADLSCLDRWEGYPENQHISIKFKGVEKTLRYTNDNNINLLIELMDKIMEVKKMELSENDIECESNDTNIIDSDDQVDSDDQAEFLHLIFN